MKSGGELYAILIWLESGIVAFKLGQEWCVTGLQCQCRFMLHSQRLHLLCQFESFNFSGTCSSWLFTLHACRITPGIPFWVDQLCLCADKSQKGLSTDWSKDCSNRRESCHAFWHTAHAFSFLPSNLKLDRHQESHLTCPFHIEILIFKEL